MYTALVLTEKSHNKLVQRMRDLIPDGWEVVAHHMTINMGNLSNGPLARHRALLGAPESLVVIAWAMDEKVLAVLVESTIPSVNESKHVTVAVNRDAGGKPFHSNNLTHWERLPEPFSLRGIIQEVQ